MFSNNLDLHDFDTKIEKNSATDFILDELSQESNTQTYGYDLVTGMKTITILGFAEYATSWLEKIEKLPPFLQIWSFNDFTKLFVSLNYNKSVSISIENDHLDERPLLINSYHNIRSLQKGVKIYLGIYSSDKILLRTGKIPQDLKHNVDLLMVVHS